MPLNARKLRIVGAALIALLMVAGGYFLPGLRFPETRPVNAALTDDLLASYIAKDTDGDGLPDWQEALYGTDVNKADTDGDGISDGNAVQQGLLTPTALASQIPQDPIGEEDIPGDPAAPGSITDEFSKAFFQAYIEASGGQPLSADAQQALLQKLLADFNSRVAQSVSSTYTIVSVHTDPNVSVSLYAKSVEDVIRANNVAEADANALVEMQALIQEDDTSAKGKLERIAAAYRGIANGLLAARVPPAFAQQHLALARAFDTLAKSTAQVARFKEDPLAVLGALAMYSPAAGQMDDGLQGLAAEVLKNGEPGANDPGFLIVYLARASSSI